MKKVILVLVLLGVIVGIYYLLKPKKSTAEERALEYESQAELIKAQAAAAEACKNNWLCATTEVTGKVSDLIGGIF